MTRILQGDGDTRHGTLAGYNYHACRCDQCRDEFRAYSRYRRHLRSALLAADDPRHGRYTTYRNWMCRCNPCLEAHRAKCRANYLARRAAASSNSTPVGADEGGE
jgi:hypothetical protein